MRIGYPTTARAEPSLCCISLSFLHQDVGIPTWHHPRTPSVCSGHRACSVQLMSLLRRLTSASVSSGSLRSCLSTSIMAFPADASRGTDSEVSEGQRESFLPKTTCPPPFVRWTSSHEQTTAPGPDNRRPLAGHLLSCVLLPPRCARHRPATPPAPCFLAPGRGPPCLRSPVDRRRPLQPHQFHVLRCCPPAAAII